MKLARNICLVSGILLIAVNLFEMLTTKGLYELWRGYEWPYNLYLALAYNVMNILGIILLIVALVLHIRLNSKQRLHTLNSISKIGRL